MIFKIHYGLWYGALVGIIPFMFSYAAEYTGASATQYGLLYTILPFVALLAKPIVGTLADRYAAHHHCLLFFIFLAILGYGSLAIYPFFPDLVDNNKNLLWILYCIAATVGNTAMCVVNSIGDSLAINSCQKKNVTYGSYRLWGPVGFGIFGAIWGIANNSSALPAFTPGIITMVIILSVNILLLAFWRDKDEFKVVVPQVIEEPNQVASSNNYGSTEQPERVLTTPSVNINQDDIAALSSSKVGRLEMIGELFKKNKSIAVFLFLFTFCGIMTGIHWQFFFRYLQEVAKQSNSNFNLVATLALPVQALGGELVFFMISGTILKKIGASMTLVICLISFAARYLLYAYLIPSVDVYWILLVELLQGPAFGLMYCVLTHQASYYSSKIDEMVVNNSDVQLKNSLHATLQGLLGASFEGLGLGLGAIIGGATFDKGPIVMWKVSGYSALALGLICAIVTLVRTFILRSKRSADIDRF